MLSIYFSSSSQERRACSLGTDFLNPMITIAIWDQTDLPTSDLHLVRRLMTLTSRPSAMFWISMPITLDGHYHKLRKISASNTVRVEL